MPTLSFPIHITNKNRPIWPFLFLRPFGEERLKQCWRWGRPSFSLLINLICSRCPSLFGSSARDDFAQYNHRPIFFPFKISPLALLKVTFSSSFLFCTFSVCQKCSHQPTLKFKEQTTEFFWKVLTDTWLCRRPHHRCQEELKKGGSSSSLNMYWSRYMWKANSLGWIFWRNVGKYTYVLERDRYLMDFSCHNVKYFYAQSSIDTGVTQGNRYCIIAHTQCIPI